MPTFPQPGGCLCGDVRYELREDPVAVYFCHCTDCQKESASAGYLGVVMRQEALAFTQGEEKLEVVEAGPPGGRVRSWRGCPRCKVRLGAAGDSGAGLRSIDGGTLDDTSWIVPAAHIWTRSAQPWIALPADAIQLPMQPTDEEWVAIAHAWRSRADAPGRS